MQLGRYQISTIRPAPILNIAFSQDGRVFAIATETGYEVWRSFPLGLMKRRTLPGTLALALPLPNSPLLVLQGGGPTPLYSPNKVVLYHDKLGAAVAELEFGERVRGVAARQGTICVALLKRTVAFEYGVNVNLGGDPQRTNVQDLKGKQKAEEGSGFWVRKLGEWETAGNELGLVALATAPRSTLLALPGRQAGHVQLVNLPPVPALPSQSAPSRTSLSAQPPRSPIILAHTHSLSSLACSATGSYIITTSERGTLLRVWDTARGRLERELRRGMDPAGMWGVRFEEAVFAPKAAADQDERRREELRRKGGRVVGWSDKGTVHVWGDEDPAQSVGPVRSATSNQQSLTNLLSRNLPLPKYFSSTASYAQYHLPRKNPHAFSSYVGAAAGAAGVPSMKLEQRDDTDEELAERFVVGWLEVEVDIGPGEKSSFATDKEDKARASRRTSGLPATGPTMGSREERRSFGSEATSSRTATPTLLRGTGLPTRAGTPPNTRRQSSHLHNRSSSGSSRPTVLPTSSTATDSKKEKDKEKDKDRENRRSRTGGAPAPDPLAKPTRQTRVERQLVAITYSGDWYRLRIPDQVGDVDEDDKGEKRKKGKCELVEYRRLGVGGGGW